MKPDVKLGYMLANTAEPILDATVITALLDDGERPDSNGLFPAFHNLADGIITGTTNLASATSNFANFAVGDIIRVDGAAAGPADLTTTLATVTDATHVILALAGVNGTAYTYKLQSASYVPTYDLNFAAAKGWLLKAAAVAAGFDFTVEMKSFQRSQMYKNFLELATQYKRRSRPYGSVLLNKSPRSYLLGRDRVYVATPWLSQGELLEEIQSGV